MERRVVPLKLFAGNGAGDLARAVSRRIEEPVAAAIVDTWPNGEVRVQLGENVRGADVFIIQSFGNGVNERLVELLVMLDAARRASAERLTAVIPYYPYAKQEQKFRGREPISARLVADLLVAAGADRVLTVDLHEGAIQGFFTIPVDHLSWLPLAAQDARKQGLGGPDTVVVAPDEGGVEHAVKLAGMLHCDVAIVFKRHPTNDPTGVETIEVVGELEGKRAVILDDFILGGSTLINAAENTSSHGATEVYAYVTHGVLCGDAPDRVQESSLKHLMVSDTIPLPEAKQRSKIKVISIAELLGDAILRVNENRSVSELLGEQTEEL